MTGRDTEDIAIDCYKAHGYQTYQPPQAKYREQDVFGLFDLLCFGHGRLEAVQVKGGRDAAGIQEWFDRADVFEAEIADLRVSFLHRKDDAWRIARFREDGYAWVYDGRKEHGPESARLADVLIK